MEAIELKKILEAYDKKLDQTLNLNQYRIKQLQQKRSKKKMNEIILYRISEVVIYSFLVFFLGWYIGNKWNQAHLVISGIIVEVFAITALVGSIGQLVLLQQIDYSKPIIEIRKKIEQVNAHKLLFLKLILLSIPVWWSYAILSLNIFLDFDLYTYIDQQFILIYLFFNFLLIIPMIWFLNKLSYKNLHLKWVKKIINFLAGSKTKKALYFLNDIEKFKNQY